MDSWGSNARIVKEWEREWTGTIGRLVLAASKEIVCYDVIFSRMKCAGMSGDGMTNESLRSVTKSMTDSKSLGFRNKGH